MCVCVCVCVCVCMRYKDISSSSSSGQKSTCDSQEDLPNNEIWTRCNNLKCTDDNIKYAKWYLVLQIK